MSRLYGFETSPGVIEKRFATPVGTVTLYSDNVSIDSPETQFYIQFYSDAGFTVPVAPGAGTITLAGTPRKDTKFDSQLWLSPSTGTGIIDATDVTPSLNAYTVPAFGGAVDRIRAIFDGITGAPYCVAYVWQK